MARGQGLENTQEYAWAKQSNGRYTIFNVPIFAEFQDEKRGQVTSQDLTEVIQNFEHDKLKNFCYPRIHIGHHEGNENRPGAGYLDNLKLANGTVFADLVEVLPEVFQAIRSKLKYPCRSAEYHPEKKKILSLALLESQSSFFPFPLLKVANFQQAVSNFNFDFPALQLQMEAESIDQFQDLQTAWACRWATIQKFQENFEEGCSCMDDPKDKKDDPEADPQDVSKEAMVEKAPQEYKCQDDIVGLGAKMDRALAMIEEIHGWEKSEHEGMNEEPEEDLGLGEEQPGEEDFSTTGDIGTSDQQVPSNPMEGIKNPMKKPSSVAYQSDRMLVVGFRELNKVVRTLVERQDKLEKEIKQKFSSLDAQQSYSLEEKALQRFCEEQGLDFQEQAVMFKKFSSASDRKAYMDAISKVGSMQRHPASRVAQRGFSTDEEKLIQKYQDDPAARKRASEALAYYKEVVTSPNTSEVRKFQAIWTDKPNRLVNWCAENPGELEAIKGY